jgi:hypothetical protein
MRWVRSFFGYSWAALGVPLVVATFIGNPFWARSLAETTGVTVSPRFTGGEVAFTVSHEGYETRVHRPVFAGLVREPLTGFVQVVWVPAEGGGLPENISEDIDYDADGTADFSVRMDRRADRLEIVPRSAEVLGLGHAFRLETEEAIRVSVRKKP